MSGLEDWQALPRFSFGDSPAMAQRLAALVVAGRKSATVGSVAQNPVAESAVGMRWVVEAAPGHAVAVIETTDLRQVRFDQMDEAFARDEGERDGTLAWWRYDHQRFFEREGTFALDMLLWAERFKLIAVLDEDFARAAPDHVAAELEEAVGGPPS